MGSTGGRLGALLGAGVGARWSGRRLAGVTGFGILAIALPAGLGSGELWVSPLFPAQQETAHRQARPEHQWNFHPVIDGCLPAGEDQDAEGGVIVH